MGEQKTMHTDVTSNLIGKYVFLPGSVERDTLFLFTCHVRIESCIGS